MYTCTICRKQFPSVDSLGNHLIFSHQLLFSDNFVCFTCKNVFKTISAYKRHLAKNHPLNVAQNLNDNVENQNINNGENENINVENQNINNGENENINVENQNINDVDSVYDSDSSVIGSEQDEQNLEFFVNSLYSNVHSYIAELYQIPTVNRKLVDAVTVATSSLISSSVSLLKDNVLAFVASFEDVPINYAENLGKIQDMFSTLMDPFEFMATEHKRFNTFQSSGTFIPPEMYEMGYVDKFITLPDNSVQLLQSPVYGQFIPLRKVLKVFLELPGVFDAIHNYVQTLYDNHGTISNFVQGTLWRDIRLHHESEGKFVLPLNLQYDDYESGNVLGSHHNSHSLGGLYAGIPCLPAAHQSSLDNLFLFSLFESKHRKKFGNNAAFAPAIAELQFLYENGISIRVDNIVIQVYFCLCLIIGDNLGYNQILNFVEQFNGNFYCRMCKLHREQMRFWYTPIPDNMLRTVDNYNEDVIVNNVSETGITGECVWNQVSTYHCVTNRHCDTMHDICLGLLKYGLCNVLNYFVNIRGYFDIDMLKDRIDGFSCINDIGNKPPTMHFSNSVLENCSLNLSAAEYLYLGLNLGVMIGDLVPEGNEVWHYYLVLREIVEIISAPSFEPGFVNYLSTLVQEHHELYIRHFGSLKPKHHLLLHYCDLLRRNGPLVLLNSLQCERNHRRGKLYARATNSRINLPLSVAIKFQLQLNERLMRKDNFLPRLKTSKMSFVSIQSLPDYMNVAHELGLNQDSVIATVKKVEVSGTLYSLNMILVLNMDVDFMPRFAKIFKIIILDSNVIFLLNSLKTELYIEHVAAYQISHTHDWITLRQSSLPYYVPLCENSYKEMTVVSLKHSL